MIRIKLQKVLHNWINIFLNDYFLIVLPRAIFRTQPKVYGGVFLQKQLMTFSCQLFSQKNPTINVQLKETIRTVTLEVAEETEIGETLWILLDNNRSKITVGVIYVPQENVTSNNKLKIMYNNISKQISISQDERQQVLILGDFSAKVGTYTEGNKPTVIKGGR